MKPLVLVSDPLQAETPAPLLLEARTPVEGFFVRNHFGTPAVESGLQVGGAVERPLRLSLDDLKRRPSARGVATLECAGNGRAFLQPAVPGAQWRLGAVGVAEFEGVPLRGVLEEAGVVAGAVEVMFAGGDGDYLRSLPVEEALRPDVLLAWGMNGRELTPDHGFPLRLVVPGWYGMASVKWLRRVEVLEEPLRARFQTDKYVYRDTGEPVRRIRVRSLILDPAEGEERPPGRQSVQGMAWGFGPVSRVEVSVDGGRSWLEAALEPGESPFAPTRWTLDWEPAPGVHRLVSRATDARGESQPLEPDWDELGYGNNGVQSVEVRVRP